MLQIKNYKENTNSIERFLIRQSPIHLLYGKPQSEA